VSKKNGLDILKNMGILYAEDDSAVRKATAKTLSVFFKTVITVDNGADALETYTSSKPDIAMFDIRMPHLNGLEVAKIIREKDQFTPIIINTSYQENEDFLKAIKLNLADYLIKPFSFEQLRLALLEAIKRMEQNNLIVAAIGNNLSYDYLTKSITKDNETILLTKNEAIILEQLLLHKGALVSYFRLEEALGLELSPSKASIKNAVLRLRKKTGKDKIINVQDFGYMIV
jgi:DNA-binding response OmpR family regulator